MKTYLLFLKHLQTGEEFVAPASADTQNEALLATGEKYPPRLYQLQTCYTLADMERILTDVKRWPGVASSVQPLIEQLTRRVATGKPLPPLQKPQPEPVRLTVPEPEPVVATAPAPQISNTMSALEALKVLREAGSAPLEAHMETRQDAPVEPEAAPQPTAPIRQPMRTVAAAITNVHKPAPSVLEVLKSLRE